MPTYILLVRLTHQGLQNIKESPARLEAGKKAFEAVGRCFSSDSSSVKRLDLGSAALGLLPSPEFHSRRYEIHSGDLFLIFTDGLVETMNSDGEEFGWDRLRAVVEKNRTRSLRGISEAIFEEGARWGNVVDDRTLLLIRFI